MTLEDLGYNDKLEKFRNENDLKEFEIGRVISEHKERYIVKTEKGEFEAEITGNLRFSSKSREDFPAVGDWVALTIHDSDFSIIHSILPRFSVISRQAVGKFGEIQIIATHIDYAFLIHMSHEFKQCCTIAYVFKNKHNTQQIQKQIKAIKKDNKTKGIENISSPNYLGPIAI